MRISDWSSDVCSSDLKDHHARALPRSPRRFSAVPPSGPAVEPKAFHAPQPASASFQPSPCSVPFIKNSTKRPPSLSRSEEHTSELQSLMRISYAVFCLKKKKQNTVYKV